MSRGLLHGLAERALGVAQPLRSQEAVRVASLPHDDPAREGAPPSPAPDARLLPGLGSVVPAALTAAQPASADESPARGGNAQPEAGRARAHTASAEAEPAAAMRPVVVDTVVNDRVVNTVPAPDRRVATQLEAPARPQPDEARVNPPAPAPLLPAQPAAWPAQIQPVARKASPQRAAEGRGMAAAEQRPTEVHVSIGRVELIAQPAAASARPVARPRESTRSLADYLRTGAKGNA